MTLFEEKNATMCAESYDYRFNLRGFDGQKFVEGGSSFNDARIKEGENGHRNYYENQSKNDGAHIRRRIK